MQAIASEEDRNHLRTGTWQSQGKYVRLRQRKSLAKLLHDLRPGVTTGR